MKMHLRAKQIWCRHGLPVSSRLLNKFAEPVLTFQAAYSICCLKLHMHVYYHLNIHCDLFLQNNTSILVVLLC